MITIIVDTLPGFYYEKLVGYTPSSFVDLVFIGERIEVGLKRGKFDYPALMDGKPGENEENKKRKLKQPPLSSVLHYKLMILSQ